MHYLVINTSAGAAVSLVEPKTASVKTAAVSDGRSQVEELSGLVSQVSAEETPVDLIVVSRGPAPFTGLRVGLVTARTLGFAWGVQVVGVDELQTQAEAVKSMGREWIVGCMDARRHEVYAALFRVVDKMLVRQTADWVGKPSELEGELRRQVPDFPGFTSENVVASGNGAKLVPQAFAQCPEFQTLAQAAVKIVEGNGLDLAAISAASREELDARGLGVEPAYLRRPDIQEKK